jgi:hypothetical protein
MLASNGEITGPCPVPLSLAVTAPCSSTPTLSHFLNQADDALVADPMLDEADEPIIVQRVEERADIGVQNEVHFPAADSHHERLVRFDRNDGASPSRLHLGPEPVDDALGRGLARGDDVELR